MAWSPVPLDSKLFLNLDETSLAQSFALQENCFVNEAGGITRFWGLEEVVDLGESGRVYLHDWRGDLIAATSQGNVYTIDKSHNATNKTGTPVAGPERITFAKDEDRLLMAAGQRIIEFDGDTTKALSDDAPDASHIGVVSNYAIAPEYGSQLWFHSNLGDFSTWDPLDVFTANSRNDVIYALVVTPFDEVIFCGPESIEQWDRLETGTQAFIQRWATGTQGLKAPGAVSFIDNALWVVTNDHEIVRVSGQVTQPLSEDIGRVLRNADDWSDAWIGGHPDRAFVVQGQTFGLLQLPNATNPYGTKGRTFILDVRSSKWAEIYGWDTTSGVPTRWPGWSYWPAFDRMYVGGEGKVYRVTTDTYDNGGTVSRMLLRTAHYGKHGPVRIDDARISVKRGTGTNTTDTTIALRYRKDNYNWSRWINKSLGKAGQTRMDLHYGSMGIARAWQFEIKVLGDSAVEIHNMDIDISALER